MGWFKVCKLLVDKNGVTTGSEDVEFEEGADLEDVSNHNSRYYRMANLLDWERFTAICDPLYEEKLGTPVKDVRFFLTLCYIQDVVRLTDEYAIDYLYAGPETQYLAGETVFQKKWAIVPEDLFRWRGQIGEENLRPRECEQKSVNSVFPTAEGDRASVKSFLPSRLN